MHCDGGYPSRTSPKALLHSPVYVLFATSFFLLLTLSPQRLPLQVCHSPPTKLKCWWCPGSVWCPVFTMSTALSSLFLDASSPPAEGLGAHVGWDEVVLAHGPWPAQEVCQAVGHTGGCVAGPLLCCYTAFQEEKEELVPAFSEISLWPAKALLQG